MKGNGASITFHQKTWRQTSGGHCKAYALHYICHYTGMFPHSYAPFPLKRVLMKPTMFSLPRAKQIYSKH